MINLKRKIGMRLKGKYGMRRLLLIILSFALLIYLFYPWNNNPSPNWIKWDQKEFMKKLTTNYYQMKTHDIKDKADADTFIINVFAWKRLASLDRLCSSLLNARYFGVPVVIHFHVEGNATSQVVEYVDAFEWPFGKKEVTIRTEKQGLAKMIVNSWDPVDDHEFAIFLEDDIEVSPLFFEYILVMMNRYVYNKEREDVWADNLFGISLYTPRLNEVVSPPKKWIPTKELPKKNLFLLQTPCSWGALYFPWWWRKFRPYYQYRSFNYDKLKKVHVIHHSKSNSWKRSWKRFFMDMAHANGLYMIYPSFPNQVSFSTHHREPGEHTGKSGVQNEQQLNSLLKQKLWQYNVPLIKKQRFATSKFFISQLQLPLSEIPVIDLFHNKRSSRMELKSIGLEAIEKLWSQGHSGLVNALGDQPGCIIDKAQFNKVFPESSFQEERYLFYQPQMGYNNQMGGFEDAIAYAKILNRTLIIPPFERSSSKQSQWISMSSIFDIRLNGYIRTISFDTFIQEHSLELKRLVYLYGSTQYLLPKDNLMESYNIKIGFNHTQSLINRKESHILRLYSQCQDRTISFNTLFESFGSFDDPQKQSEYKKILKDLWKLDPPILNFFKAVAKKIPLERTLCLHIRMGDFKEYCGFLNTKVEKMSQQKLNHSWLKNYKYSNCFPDTDTIEAEVQAFLLQFPNISNVYISTNNASLKLNIKNVKLIDGAIFKEEFSRGLWPLSSSLKFDDVLPILEQEIGKLSGYFIGNYYSTFSRRIVSSRTKPFKYFGYPIN